METANLAIQEWIPQLISLDVDCSVKIDIAERIKKWQDSEELSVVLSVFSKWQQEILHAIEIMILSIEVSPLNDVEGYKIYLPALLVAECLRNAACKSVELSDEIFSGVIFVLANVLEAANGMKFNNAMALHRERIMKCLLDCLPVLSKFLCILLYPSFFRISFSIFYLDFCSYQMLQEIAIILLGMLRLTNIDSTLHIAAIQRLEALGHFDFKIFVQHMDEILRLIEDFDHIELINCFVGFSGLFKYEEERNFENIDGMIKAFGFLRLKKLLTGIAQEKPVLLIPSIGALVVSFRSLKDSVQQSLLLILLKVSKALHFFFPIHLHPPLFLSVANVLKRLLVLKDWPCCLH
jgi:hypothetical protein